MRSVGTPGSGTSGWAKAKARGILPIDVFGRRRLGQRVRERALPACAADGADTPAKRSRRRSEQVESLQGVSSSRCGSRDGPAACPEGIGRSLGPRSTRPSRALEPWAPWSTRLVRAVHRAPAAPGLDGGLACVVAGGKCRGYRGPRARTALDGEGAPECLYAVAQTC